MRALVVTQATVVEALKNGNQASGGSVVEMAECEYMVRSRGFLRTLDDFRNIALSLTAATPVMLRDTTFVQVGPEMRRGFGRKRVPVSGGLRRTASKTLANPA